MRLDSRAAQRFNSSFEILKKSFKIKRKTLISLRQEDLISYHCAFSPFFPDGRESLSTVGCARNLNQDEWGEKVLNYPRG